MLDSHAEDAVGAADRFQSVLKEGDDWGMGRV